VGAEKNESLPVQLQILMTRYPVIGTSVCCQPRLCTLYNHNAMAVLIVTM